MLFGGSPAAGSDLRYPGQVLLHDGRRQQPRYQRRHPGAGRSAVQEEMPDAGSQGIAVPGEPPLLVERGAAQRGRIPDRQGQPGAARLEGGLHRHPLRADLGAG